MNTNFSSHEEQKNTKNIKIINTDVKKEMEDVITETSVNFLIFKLIQLEIFQIKELWISFNPTKVFSKINQAYKNKNILKISQELLICFNYSFIFFCFPFWIIFSIVKILFSQQVWKLSFWKLNFFILNFQKSIKKPIQSLNLGYIIGAIPFGIGFLQFLYTKYQKNSFFYFFEKNLPGISLSAEILEWETFQYIQSKKIKSPINLIEKVDISNESIFLSLKQFWHSKQKKLYFGSFSQQKFIPNKVPKTPQSLFNLEASSKNLFHNAVPKNYLNQDNKLDKTKKLSNLSIQSHGYRLSSQSLADFKVLSKKNTLEILPNIFKQIKIPQDYVKIFYLSLDELPLKLNSINSNTQNNEFYKTQNIFPFITTKFGQNIPENSISEKKPFKKEYSLRGTGILSGHSTSSSTQFFNSIFFKKSKNLPFKEFSKKKKLIGLTNNPFLIQPIERKVNLKKFSENEKKFFFQKRENFLQNREILQNALKTFFYETGLVPVLFSEDFEKKMIRFIPFSSSVLVKQTSTPKFLPENFWYFNSNFAFKNIFFDFEENFSEEILGIINRIFLPQEQKLISNRKNSGYISPDTQKSELKKILMRVFFTNFSALHFDPNLSVLFKIPIPETLLPSFHLNINLLSKNNKIPNQFYWPWGETSLDAFLLQKVYSSGLYKNELSLYENQLGFKKLNKTSSKLWEKSFLTQFHISFQDFWEPLTLKSWLVVTKLSFGFFAFKLLQNIYNNYRQELSLLADVLAALGIIDESTKQELLLNENEKGFRVLKKIKKKFQDIAGIENVLPELGEIVWFLRNSGRFFQVGNLIPKGILLVGPPGTGKTLLVQAIAGEAQVPALVLSGSSLNDPEKPGNGAIRLKALFQEARNVAPCIVFIDEIDTLGQKRDQVMKNPMGADQVIESISEFQNLHLSGITNNFFSKPRLQKNFQNLNEDSLNNKNETLENTTSNNQSKQEQLTLLMQFLVEMDGLQARNRIIVIGATNRPDVLDSAFLRPGRFDKIIQLDLPGKQKRIDILKLYSSPLGSDKTVSWDYFAERTLGLSAADLAAIMNESAMRAIILKTTHNLETIEQGIDRITSYSVDKPDFVNKNRQDPFFLNRLAYYQAGKALIHSLLPFHPETVVVHLWPRKKNTRYLRITNNLQKEIYKFSRREELENRVIGFSAGKAAEFLVLGRKSEISLKTKNISNFWVSDLGYDDLSFANFLVYLMIDQWYFYSKKVSYCKLTQLPISRNYQELFELEKIERFQQLTEQIENPHLSIKNSFGQESHNKLTSIKTENQKKFLGPWWQSQVAQELEILNPSYAEWYRLYLPDPEESEFNEEWLPSDEFYHNNSWLMDFLSPNQKNFTNWNDFYEIERDYIFHGLILNCFNKALNLLENQREVLDFLAQSLLNHEILRQNELKVIFTRFKIKKAQGWESQYKSVFETQDNFDSLLFINKKVKTQVTKSWGKNSKRLLSRFIDFEKVH